MNKSLIWKRRDGERNMEPGGIVGGRGRDRREGSRVRESKETVGAQVLKRKEEKPDWSRRGRGGEGGGQGGRRGGRRSRREEEEGEQEEGGEEEKEEGELGRQLALGPSTHTGKEEQDSCEERDDLTSQPQVVHRGTVRVGRLRGGADAAGLHLPSTPVPRCPKHLCPQQLPLLSPPESPPPSHQGAGVSSSPPQAVFTPLPQRLLPCPSPQRALTVPSSG